MRGVSLIGVSQAEAGYTVAGLPPILAGGWRLNTAPKWVQKTLHIKQIKQKDNPTEFRNHSTASHLGDRGVAVASGAMGGFFSRENHAPPAVASSPGVKKRGLEADSPHGGNQSPLPGAHPAAPRAPLPARPSRVRAPSKPCAACTLCGRGDRN